MANSLVLYAITCGLLIALTGNAKASDEWVFDVEDFFPSGGINTTALMVLIQNIRKEKCKTSATKISGDQKE